MTDDEKDEYPFLDALWRLTPRAAVVLAAALSVWVAVEAVRGWLS